jgi:hypothetical protein
MATPTTLPASFTAGQVLTAAQMNALRGAFRVLQVVSTAKTDTFTTGSTTYTDITGLTATITPSSTSSKILIYAQVSFSAGPSAGNAAFFRINGGNASNFIGNGASTRTQAAIFAPNSASWPVGFTAVTYPIMYLDSPATTSATTYAVQGRTGTAGTLYINRSDLDTDSANYGRVASSITVMEISA